MILLEGNTITVGDALDRAITAVEGPHGWRRSQHGISYNTWGDQFGEPVWSRTKVIYGKNGGNRYFVRKHEDGTKEVTFSGFHSNAEGIAKAKAAGFRIED